MLMPDFRELTKLMSTRSPTSGRDKIRSEYFEGHLSYTEAFALVSEFYTDNSILVTSPDNVNSGQGLLPNIDIVVRLG